MPTSLVTGGGKIEGRTGASAQADVPPAPKRRCLPPQFGAGGSSQDAATTSAAPAVKTEVDSKDALRPLTLSSQGGGANPEGRGVNGAPPPKTEEKPPLRAGPAAQQPQTISSHGGRGSMRAETPLSQPKVEPKLENQVAVRGTLNLDTPASQLLRSEPYSQPLRSQPLRSLPKPAQEPKPEDEQNGAPLVESSALAKIEAAAEAEPPRQRVQHPTGVWLSTLTVNRETSAKQELTTIVDGIEIARATWRAGRAEVFGATPRSCRPAPIGTQPRRRAGQNFKLFRKADGQRAFKQTEIVPVVPWVPAAGAPLDDFCSQPVDSQSQFPPMA